MQVVHTIGKNVVAQERDPAFRLDTRRNVLGLAGQIAHLELRKRGQCLGRIGLALQLLQLRGQHVHLLQLFLTEFLLQLLHPLGEGGVLARLQFAVGFANQRHAVRVVEQSLADHPAEELRVLLQALLEFRDLFVDAQEEQRVGAVDPGCVGAVHQPEREHRLDFQVAVGDLLHGRRDTLVRNAFVGNFLERLEDQLDKGVTPVGFAALQAHTENRLQRAGRVARVRQVVAEFAVDERFVQRRAVVPQENELQHAEGDHILRIGAVADQPRDGQKGLAFGFVLGTDGIGDRPFARRGPARLSRDARVDLVAREALQLPAKELQVR